MNFGNDFYKISSNGCGIELVESVYVDCFPYEESLKYYHEAESNNEISEEEYNLISQSYKNVEEVKLNWIEIDK